MGNLSLDFTLDTTTTGSTQFSYVFGEFMASHVHSSGSYGYSNMAQYTAYSLYRHNTKCVAFSTWESRVPNLLTCRLIGGFDIGAIGGWGNIGICTDTYMFDNSPRVTFMTGGMYYAADNTRRLILSHGFFDQSGPFEWCWNESAAVVNGLANIHSIELELASISNSAVGPYYARERFQAIADGIVLTSIDYTNVNPNNTIFFHRNWYPCFWHKAVGGGCMTALKRIDVECQ